MAGTRAQQEFGEAAGYVLVGGLSARFGSPKALHPMDGRAMALRVADVLAERVSVVTLVGDPAAYGALGLPVIADRVDAAGPLAGIVAALHHLSSQWCIVAACDMPHASAAVVDRLLAAAATLDVDAVVPRTSDGRLQPLFAAYAKSGLERLEHALIDGTRKVTEALDSVRWEELEFDDPGPFANVNRPEDLPNEG